MKPTIVFTCTNQGCSENRREVHLAQYSFFESTREGANEEYWLARISTCPKCHERGELRIEHGDRVFSNMEAFDEYLLGLAKEAKLLKRLFDHAGWSYALPARRAQGVSG